MMFQGILVRFLNEHLNATETQPLYIHLQR